MAAITSTLVSLAGIGLSAAQAIKGQQQAKAANAAAEAASAGMKSQQATNEMATLQTPDVSSLAFQEAQAGTKMSVQALQEMGPEAAASVGAIAAANRAAGLKAAQAQGVAQQATQEKILAAEQAKEDKNLAMRREELSAELQGAREAEQAGKAQMIQGVTSAVTGLGQFAGAFNDYGVAKGFIDQKYDVLGGAPDISQSGQSSTAGQEKIIDGVLYKNVGGQWVPQG